MNQELLPMIRECLDRHPGEPLSAVAQSRDGVRLARTYLSSLAAISAGIALGHARIDAIRGRGVRVRALSQAYARGGDAADPVGDAAQEIADLERETLERYRLLTKTERGMIAVIDRIGDPTYRMILHARHIEGVKIPHIAARAGFSERHLYKLYDKALSVVALILLSDEKYPDNREKI